MCGVLMVNNVIELIHRGVVHCVFENSYSCRISFAPFCAPCRCGYKVLESVLRVAAFRMKSCGTCTIGRGRRGDVFVEVFRKMKFCDTVTTTTEKRKTENISYAHTQTHTHTDIYSYDILSSYDIFL